jgi:proteasome accessory factor A
MAVFGLETEHSIYPRWDLMGGPLKNTGETHRVVDSIVESAFQLPEIMGPQHIVTFGRQMSAHRLQWLHNGSRFYNDIGAPELSLPECWRPDTLVAYDQAGIRIMRMAVARAEQELGYEVDIYRKNTDGHGHTYGCHENYCVAARLHDELTKGPVPKTTQHVLATFLIVRSLLTGAGKVGIEDHGDMRAAFQLTQRMDFVNTFMSGDTTIARPLINTRDEGHADKTQFNRLHYIIGDANMCQVPTYLKVGLTALLLSLLEEAGRATYVLPTFYLGASEYPKIAQRVSWDVSMEHRFPVIMTRRQGQDRKDEMSAAEILHQFLIRLELYVRERSFDTAEERVVYADVVARAHEALEHLRSGRVRKLYGTLDWPTKYILLDEYLKRRGRTWDEAARDDGLRRRMRSYVDLAYGSIKEEGGTYWNLLRTGVIRTIVGEDAIARAVMEPPEGRAALRTALVDTYLDAVRGMDWNKVMLSGPNRTWTIKLPDPKESLTPEHRRFLATHPTLRDLNLRLRGARRKEE